MNEEKRQKRYKRLRRFGITVTILLFLIGYNRWNHNRIPIKTQEVLVAYTNHSRNKSLEVFYLLEDKKRIYPLPDDVQWMDEFSFLDIDTILAWGGIVDSNEVYVLKYNLTSQSYQILCSFASIQEQLNPIVNETVEATQLHYLQPVDDVRITFIYNPRGTDKPCWFVVYNTQTQAVESALKDIVGRARIAGNECFVRDINEDCIISINLNDFTKTQKYPIFSYVNGVSSDGQMVVTSEDRNYFIQDLQSGETVKSFKLISREGTSDLRFSSDNRYVALAYPSPETLAITYVGEISVFDTKTGRLYHYETLENATFGTFQTQWILGET